MILTEHQLDILISITQNAGEAILPHYHSVQLDVMTKDDHSPLTAADLASHHTIMDGLQSHFPNLPIVSEEGDNSNSRQRMSWETYWLIDPLDGTKEFINKRDEFTVNIALIHQGYPIAATVLVPVTGECFFAAKTKGCFKLDATGVTQTIHTRAFNHHRFELVASKSHRSETLENYLNTLPQHHAISMGSSLKFCVIAEGKADFYPRLGPTCEWDTAAAQCIVEQAGGLVIDWHGNRLRYNTRESLLNPHFAVIGDSNAPWRQWLDNKV